MGYHARMIRLATPTIALAAAALLVACSAPRARPAAPAAPETVQQGVAAIDAHLRQDRQIVGKWQNEETSSTYHAYFNGAAPVYIVETAGGERDQGYAVNKYYYRNGRLFYFRGQGSAGSPTILNPEPTDIDIQLAFNHAGALTRAVKRVNGHAVSLEPGEAAAIRGHARQLRSQALADLARQ